MRLFLQRTVSIHVHLCICIIYYKTRRKFSWGHHHHSTSWKGLFRWARVLFRCPGEEHGRILQRGNYWRVADTSQDEALARKIPSAIFSDPLNRNSIPTLQHSTPTHRRVCVCWRKGEGDTPSYKLYNQVSLLDISLPNVSEFAYRLMKVEVSHIYLPQSYALYNMICFAIGYCNQSDGFISHISPGIVINISGNQLVWYWMGVGIIIGFQ